MPQFAQAEQNTGAAAEPAVAELGAAAIPGAGAGFIVIQCL